MKKILFILSLMPLLVSGQWELVDPIPVSDPLNSVFWVNGDICWAIGECGKIIASNDAAQTWQQIHSGTSDQLFSVFFADPQHGWISGESGLILRTTDGGITFDAYYDSYHEKMYSVFFVNGSVGFAGGSNKTLLKTIDGGDNWEKLFIPGPVLPLFTVFFTDENHGVIGGKDFLMYTEDGGETWVSSNIGSPAVVYSVFFTDAIQGWASGYSKYITNSTFGAIMRTDDGGQTWAITDTIDMEWGHGLKSVCFINDSTGYICGYDTVLRTDNYGLDWEGLDIEVGYSRCISFNDEKGVICGDYPELLTSTDGGENWNNACNTLFGKQISAVRFIDKQKGWIAGEMGLYRTVNQGEQWDCLIADSVLFDIFVPDQNQIWATGIGYENPSYFIVKSENGGESWVEMLSSDTMMYWQIDFTDTLTGLVLGSNLYNQYSTLFITEDGGNTWQASLNFFNYYEIFLDLFVLNSNNIWVTGHNGLENTGLLYYSSDMGQTWSIVTLQDVVPTHIFYTDSLHGWLSSYWGHIYKTASGGQTWDEIVIPGVLLSDPVSYFIDALNGWIIANNGVILRTADGGETWHHEYPGTSRDLKDIAFAENTNGWIVGNKVVLRRTEHVNTDVEVFPAPFDENQTVTCYPNPFDDHTSIKFETGLPGTTVEFRIFDISGHELSCLKSYEPEAGKHSVWFDTGTFLPGVYFCVLTKGSMKQVVKMIKIY
ncbi:MAG: T9SS type A sorting domain-containing protein [Bacteroidales bacterium]|nr:T9SS type A sorting domain-containing protein [Bacteroidales bacterium]